MSWLWAIWTFFFRISSWFYSFLKEFIMAFLFVLSSNKVNIFYHILKLEKKHRFIPKGIFLPFFLLKWNCSYGIPKCLLLEWFLKIIQNHLHNVHHWAASEFSCQSLLGWFLRPQWQQTVEQCPLPPEKGFKSMMDKGSDGSIPQCLDGVRRPLFIVIYLLIQANVDLQYSVLFRQAQKT